MTILARDYDDAEVAPTDIIQLHLAEDAAEAERWAASLARGVAPD